MHKIDLKQLGRKRLAFSTSAENGEKDWDEWHLAQKTWDYSWGSCWKAQTILHVDQYEAELGFFIDLLGFDAMVLTKEYSLINSEDETFTLGLRPSDENTPSVNPKSFSLNFMVKDLERVTQAIEKNGADFHKKSYEYSGMKVSDIYSPSGILVRIWESSPTQNH